MVRRIVILGLVVVGLLFLGGYVGWMQGYDAGLTAEGNAAASGYYGFGILGFFLKFLLIVFLFFLISKLLFFGAWRHRGRHGGPRGRDWREWHEREHEELDEGKSGRGHGDEGDNPVVA